MQKGCLLGALLLVACGGAAGVEVESADAVEGARRGGNLEAGTSVCISDLVGVRYALEDALEQHELAPSASCMGADVQLSEAGQGGAWIMKYRRVGETKWQECRSEQDSRREFAAECIGAMKGDLGGS